MKKIRKSMKKMLWSLIELLLLSTLELSCAVDDDCNYRQKLDPGVKYYVVSPGYPNKYSGSKSCYWYAQSDSRIKLTCTEFNVPESINCQIDSFDVFIDESWSSRRYCNNRPFIVESTGKNMAISLTTSAYTPGGTFVCHLETTDVVNEINDCKCGWKNPSRIVGGDETGVNEYPMMAGIFDLLLGNIYCGGTIISTKHILTAAHCIDNRVIQNVAIIVGEHNTKTGLETDATKIYNIAYVISHPLYETSEDYDIAIISTDVTISFTNKIGPACLPFQHEYSTFESASVDVLGWGLFEYGGEQATTLQKATVKVTNFDTCRAFYPQLKQRQICTYAIGKDACQSDSGGPVLWQNPNTGRIVLIGIISYGVGCATQYPGVSTRVGSFINWILQNTDGAQYCRAE